MINNHDIPTCTLTIMPSGISQEVKVGTLLSEALMDMGIQLKTPCGGNGTCGKCRVQVEGEFSELDPHETEMCPDGWRLACRAHIQGDVKAFITDEQKQRHKVYPEIAPDSIYSIAVDIGTTTVKMSLISHPKKAIELDSFLNPQRRFGYDVISRIAAASDPEIFQRQHSLIVKSISSAIKDAISDMKLSSSGMRNIVFSGNTAMLYLLAGIDVAAIGRAPYHAPQLDFGNNPVQLDMVPDSRTYIMPVHSAFLGGDLIGGLAICHSMDLVKGTLFIDLGTNGELFLGDGQGRIFATSCAMGPALEGMNISYGMTADPGAITHIYEKDGGLFYDMLDGNGPVGITGTALIDVLAVLLNHNAIASNGRFLDANLPYPAQHVKDQGHKRIKLWGDISVSQRDVRNVQLAKAASLAAAKLLLAEADNPVVERVIVAGALGEHLNMDNFRRLGFLPEFPGAKYTYLGNTSLKAAEKACIDPEFLSEARLLRDKVKEVALFNSPAFYNAFVDAMAFPKQA